MESAQFKTVAEVEAVAKEVQERLDRACNVLFHKLPESLDDGTVSDLESVKQIISVFLNNSISVNSVRRLGNRTSQASRPLLVCLSSHNDVIKIIHARAKLPPNITISADKTPRQREHLKMLRGEVDKLNTEDPHHPKSIKYVDGTPTIVDKVAEEVPKN